VRQLYKPNKILLILSVIFFTYSFPGHLVFADSSIYQKIKTYFSGTRVIESIATSPHFPLDARFQSSIDAGIYQFIGDVLNPHIKNLTASIDKDKGTLTIKFDYPEQYWGKYYFPVRHPFFIRLLDKNKQDLTKFKTKENSCQKISQSILKT